MSDDKVVEKKIEKKKIDKRFEVSFRQNRSFELRIGRKTIFFLDGEKKAILSESEINHPDFIQQKDYFSVKEV